MKNLRIDRIVCKPKRAAWKDEYVDDAIEIAAKERKDVSFKLNGYKICVSIDDLRGCVIDTLYTRR